MKRFTLEIPNITHKSEYERVMTKWEQMEENIQPELMRRYSKKLNGNIPFAKWLEYCEDDRTTGSMLSTHVPCTLFFMLNDQREIVGSIVLNHADTKHGHLHAGIVPWCRGKGYGTAMLALALKECQKKGIRKVHICPNSKDNTAAIHTILNNGGYLLDDFIEKNSVILRYEIDLFSTDFESHMSPDSALRS
jgi:predicted acetyltransferase